MSESIQSRGLSGLDEATPILWDPLKHYAVTITFKPKLEIPYIKAYRRSVLDNKITVQKVIKTTLVKKSPQRQYELTRNMLMEKFDKENLEYDLYGEFHENGQIHYHGVIGHKQINGSLVRAQIKYILQKWGPQHKIKDLFDLKGWYSYCTEDESCKDFHFHSAPHADKV